MLSEEKIINYLMSEFPKYIGDDAAIVPYSTDQSYVIAKDLLVEDVHFRQSYLTPNQLAYKAIQVNLSDLAAVGAKPQFILLAIAIPDSYQNYLNQFLQSFSETCKSESVILIGGDTTKSLDKFFISITTIGIAQNSKLKYRSTAVNQDLICIAGNLGHAHLGLTSLEINHSCSELFINNFLKPKALIKEGIWLSNQSSVHAMMDVSDGLFVDLKKLCNSSKVGAKVQLDNLIMTPQFLQDCQNLKLDPIKTTLIGGEDYGLLFTTKFSDYLEISKNFKEIFNYDLKQIGSITDDNKIIFYQNDLEQNLELHPFSHFGEL